MSEMDYLDMLSNRELRKKCLEYGLPNVPVTNTSRKVLLRKLRAAIDSSPLEREQNEKVVKKNTKKITSSPKIEKKDQNTKDCTISDEIEIEVNTSGYGNVGNARASSLDARFDDLYISSSPPITQKRKSLHSVNTCVREGHIGNISNTEYDPNHSHTRHYRPSNVQLNTSIRDGDVANTSNTEYDLHHSSMRYQGPSDVQSTSLNRQSLHALNTMNRSDNHAGYTSGMEYDPNHSFVQHHRPSDARIPHYPRRSLSRASSLSKSELVTTSYTQETTPTVSEIEIVDDEDEYNSYDELDTQSRYSPVPPIAKDFDARAHIRRYIPPETTDLRENEVLYKSGVNTGPYSQFTSSTMKQQQQQQQQQSKYLNQNLPTRKEASKYQRDVQLYPVFDTTFNVPEDLYNSNKIYDESAGYMSKNMREETPCFKEFSRNVDRIKSGFLGGNSMATNGIKHRTLKLENKHLYNYDKLDSAKTSMYNYTHDDDGSNVNQGSNWKSRFALLLCCLLVIVIIYSVFIEDNTTYDGSIV